MAEDEAIFGDDVNGFVASVVVPSVIGVVAVDSNAVVAVVVDCNTIAPVVTSAIGVVAVDSNTVVAVAIVGVGCNDNVVVCSVVSAVACNIVNIVVVIGAGVTTVVANDDVDDEIELNATFSDESDV
jgi:hypothetical protein